jgi:hypothetical protein
LRLPREVIEQPGVAPVAPFLGAVAGLLLGIGAAVMLERMLPQVRSAADLHALANWPVFTFTKRSGRDRYETVVLRVLDSIPGVRQVAIVRTGALSEEAQASLVRQLTEAEQRLRGIGRIPGGGSAVDWQFLGSIPDDGSVERSVQDADAVLLVIPGSALLKPATLAVQRLKDLAVRNVVVVLGLTPRSPRSKARGQTPPQEPAAGEPVERQDTRVGTQVR